MNFYFYKINNNLNRIYRTLEFFGIENIFLCKCANILKGNLFKAENKVNIIEIDNLPDDENTIYFETDGNINIKDINLLDYQYFVFGGESNNLPKNKNVKRVYIPKKGNISGLTVESALTVVLWELYNKIFN
jgi:tRNA(Leu) C34 or U34 (ribose-2'-O)-methylase TrmL